MKTISVILLLGAAFLLSFNLLYAQEEKTRVGFGVSIGKETMIIEEGTAFTLFDFPSFYMPILISRQFRLEPWIGLYRYSRTVEDRKNSYMLFSLGCGIFSMKDKGKVDIYYGARFGLVHISYSYKYSSNDYNEDDEDSKTDFYIGPAIGGEYFFTDHLSLGGEAQLSYAFIDQLGHNDKDVSESLISSKTLIFVRWYF